MDVKDISEFLTLIQGLQVQYPEEIQYFRGESLDSWELRPSLMRDGLIRSESEMLTELMARCPDEFKSEGLAISQWVLAQHHGLRTRFLDLTRNPLVALFFACESDFFNSGRLHVFSVPRILIKPFNSDSISVIANFAKLPENEQKNILTAPPNIVGSGYVDSMRHLHQLIRGEKPYFEDRIDVRDLFRVFIVEPQQSSDRIRTQSGAFLVSAYHQRFERKEVLCGTPNIPVYAHYTPIIPGSSKESILRELRLLNITRETLFPGLDESAKAITETYRQRLSQA